MAITGEQPPPSSLSLAGDVVQRLQQLVAGWRGSERGQPLSELHEACAMAVGPGGRPLLPARLLLVAGLDATALQAELGRLRGTGQGTGLQFRVRPVGRFDAALVPSGPVGQVPDRWLLAVEEGLAPRDQVALYGHALALLSLVREQRQMGQLPELDPRDGYAHADTLAELRLSDGARSALDRRVLEAYPLLTELLRGRDEPAVVADASTVELRQRLGRPAGGATWSRRRTSSPPGASTSVGRKRGVGGASAWMRCCVRRRRCRSPRCGRYGRARRVEVATRQIVEYARDRLAVPFAYLLDDEGAIPNSTGRQRASPRGRYGARSRAGRAVGAVDGRYRARGRASAAGPAPSLPAWAVPPLLPGGGDQPRRHRDPPGAARSALATGRADMATGTGKTRSAFQIVWKLRRARELGKRPLPDGSRLLAQPGHGQRVRAVWRCSPPHPGRGGDGARRLFRHLPGDRRRRAPRRPIPRLSAPTSST